MSNLILRVLTAALAAPVLVGLLFAAPPWGWLLFVALVAGIAAHELMRMMLPRRPLLRLYGTVAAVALYAVVVAKPQAEVIVSAMLLLTVGALLCGLMSSSSPPDAATEVAWLIAGPCYAGGLSATLGLLSLRPQGPHWVVLAMFLAWFGDTGGYFIGRWFGKHQLMARISPNKTWEGSLGGLLGSTLGAVVAHFSFLPQLPLLGGIALALFAGALGQLGDLCESLLKRAADCKDSGSIVPGHGGMLDRVDALLFAATATWMAAQWLVNSVA